MTDINEGRHEDQLSPVAMPYHNLLMKGPPGTDIGDLSTWVGDSGDGTAVVYSSWVLDDRHRDMIAGGAHIRLGVWQHPIPPLAVAIEGPWCEARALHPDGNPVEKLWNGHTFYCPHCEEDHAQADRTSPPVTPDDLRRDFRPDRDE